MDEDRAGEEAPAREYAPSDPAYWAEALGGTPEAARLVQQAPLSLAIMRGKPRAVFDALRKMQRTARSLQERELIQSALQRRRLFGEPIRGAPGMATLNGIGTTCRGKQDRQPEDGSYITTHWVTLLWLPLWPLGQYLVRDAGGGAWHFFARVPMSGFHRWWRRIVAAGAVAAALLIGLSIR